MSSNSTTGLFPADTDIGRIFSTLALAALILGSSAPVALAKEAGIFGRSGNPAAPTNGSSCAACHNNIEANDGFDPSKFRIEGPTIALGATVLTDAYSLRMSLDVNKWDQCGWNVSVTGGSLAISPSIGKETDGEITHSMPSNSCSSTLFTLMTQAVTTPANVTLYGAGLHASNNDTSPDTVNGDLPFLHNRIVTVVPSAPVLIPGLLTLETQLPDAPDSLDPLIDVAASPDGEWVYVVGSNGLIANFSQAAGVLTYGASLTTAGVDPVAVATGASDVYVASTPDERLAGYRQNTGTGVLDPLFTNLDARVKRVTDVAVNPSATKVYVTGANNESPPKGGLAEFDRNTGTGQLTYIGGSPLIEDDAPQAVVSYEDPANLLKDGGKEWVYAVGSNNGPNVTVFERANAGSNLAIAQTFTNNEDGIGGISQPVDVAISPDGKHVYVVSDGGEGHLVVFLRSASDGMLTFVEAIENGAAGFAGLAKPVAVQVDPTGNFVYVTDSAAGGALTAFRRSATSDYLEQVDTESAPGARGLELSPTGERIYVATDTTGPSLSVFLRSPVCGDGAIAGSEACDDGNTTSGDGCSATCTTESGYTCSGMPSMCTNGSECGNSMLDVNENCDDGNMSSGDGCSATCTTEMGWMCTGLPSMCTRDPSCGNGMVEGTEVCDDGNLVSGDGCTATCQVEITQAGFDVMGGYTAYLADPANADLRATGICDAASASAHWLNTGNVQKRSFAGGRLRTDKVGGAPDSDYSIDGGYSWDYQGYKGKMNTVVFITKDAPKPTGWAGRFLLLERCQEFNLGGAYLARDYASINTDVRDAIDGKLIPGFSSVTDHYVKYGFKEGRLTNSGWTRPQLDAWNDAGYLAANPDVRTFFLGAQSEGWIAFGKIGFAHYINFGQYEMRPTGQ